MQTSLKTGAFVAVMVLALTAEVPLADDAVELAQVDLAAIEGVWQGQYAYDDDRLEPKEFTAAIQVRTTEANAFFGEVTEPRYTRLGMAGENFAEIAGTVGADGSVQFIKTYVGAEGFNNPVIYQGQMDQGGARIEGTWTVDGLTGSFEMTRTPTD